MSQARRNREEKNKNLVNQLQDFANDSIVFFNKCAKPNKEGKWNSVEMVILDCGIEYMKILQACAMGFLVIGFIGYIIKLVFIPINNIILGAWVSRERA